MFFHPQISGTMVAAHGALNMPNYQSNRWPGGSFCGSWHLFSRRKLSWSCSRGILAEEGAGNGSDGSSLLSIAVVRRKLSEAIGLHISSCPVKYVASWSSEQGRRSGSHLPRSIFRVWHGVAVGSISKLILYIGHLGDLETTRFPGQLNLYYNHWQSEKILGCPSLSMWGAMWSIGTWRSKPLGSNGPLGSFSCRHLDTWRGCCPALGERISRLKPTRRGILDLEFIRTW